VLALQGAFAKHLEVLERLGVSAVEVRQPEELDNLDGLIIPGGETTTMVKLMKTEGWFDRMRDFGNDHPVMGTCAGMVLMGQEVDDPRVEPFGWMPIRVHRNAYGSQVNSFRDTGCVEDLPGPPEMEMVFIRAPRFEPLSNDLTSLGMCRGESVMVRSGHFLAMAFHPELTDEVRIHRYWLDMVRKSLPADASAEKETESRGPNPNSL
jgi:5'-phosphate synthase pdxT subunit